MLHKLKKYSLLFLLLFSNYYLFPQQQSNNFNTELFQYISPVPGSELLLRQTNIIIRQGEELTGVDLNDTTLLTVNGSISGKHSGNLYLTIDSKTLIFEPNLPFTNGEKVEVYLKSGLRTITGNTVDSLGFSFSISRGCTNPPNSITKTLDTGKPNSVNRINNLLKAEIEPTIILPADFPDIRINSKVNPEDGFYFIGINQATSNYISIINNSGIPIFYKKINGRNYDFKLQSNGILTYYDETAGKFYGLDSLYQVVDSFYSGNGYSTDFHDLQVLPNGHYFTISYDPQPVNMDTVVSRGDTSACVIGCVIQEIDNNKRVIWQWRSWDHYNITDADLAIDLTGKTIAYCHINSIDVPDDNNIIFSVKHFNEITNVNRNTGKIIWRLGGKNNQFAITGDPISFKFPHDARYLVNNKVSFFDNGDFTRNSTRAIIYNLDSTSRTTSLFKEFKHSPNIWSKVMGNVQTTENGNTIIGWGNTGGATNFITEYDQKGNLTNDITLTSSNFIFSYRAFKFSWQQKLLTSATDSVIFPKITIGTDKTKTLIIFNNSSQQLDITETLNSNTAFNITDTFPLTITANSNLNLTLKFSSSTSNEITDTLYIITKTDEQMIALPIIVIGNSDIVTSVENGTFPKDFILNQNYPNPFNPSTKISYFLPQKSRVILKIYNVLGEEIITLLNKIQNNGNHEATWKSKNNASGIYFYTIEVKSLDGNSYIKETKKMLLLK